MALTTLQDVATRIAQGKMAISLSVSVAATGATAAGATSGLMSMTLIGNAIGSTYPGTLEGFQQPPAMSGDYLNLISFIGNTASARGGSLVRVYLAGTLNLTGVGNQFTHNAATFPLLRTKYGAANQPVNLIPIIQITTATTTTAAAFQIASVSGGGITLNGTTQYMSVGTLGSFGTGIETTGYSITQEMAGTSTAGQRLCGYLNTGTTDAVIVHVNEYHDGAAVIAQSGCVASYTRDASPLQLAGYVPAATLTTAGININDGNPHHIAVSVMPSTNTITFVIDGISFATTYTVQATPNNFGNLGFSMYFGCNNNRGTAANFFTGTMKNIKLYSTNLSTAQLQSVYAGSEPAIGSLVGNWQFIEGSGTTVGSGTGTNNGTLVASPTWVAATNSAGYVNQDGSNVVGTTTFTLPAAATATGSCYFLRLNAGDYAVQDITQIKVTTAAATGAANIWLMEEIACSQALVAGASQYDNFLDAGLNCATITPAVATSGTANTKLLFATFSNATSTAGILNIAVLS